MNFFKKIFKADKTDDSFEIPEVDETKTKETKKVKTEYEEKPKPFVSPLFGKDKNIDTTKVFMTKVDSEYYNRVKTLTKGNLKDEDKYKGFVMGDSEYYLNQLSDKEREEALKKQRENKQKASLKEVENLKVDIDYPEDYFGQEEEKFNLDDLDFEDKKEVVQKEQTMTNQINASSDKSNKDKVSKESFVFHEKTDHKSKIKYDKPIKRVEKPFVLPSLSLLKKVDQSSKIDTSYLQDQELIINNTLEEFSIAGHVVNYTNGPTVTQFEVKLDPGVKVNRVTNIEDNLKMNLANANIRIEAPIPGKATIGIEVPNKIRRVVFFSNIFTKDFVENSKPLEVMLGVNNGGEKVTCDISKMPHGLIAGATGSGKSVCLDTFLVSLIMKNTPDDLKLILIDPKVVGLANYKDIPHLITPIIQEPSIASEALKWVVEEMERRYQLLYNVNAKDIKSYNRKIAAKESFKDYQKMPYIVVVIEEMADLMAQVGNEVEESVMRITAKARACGIHLIVATQRPSVDVIKGTIKSNIPTRIAMKVSSMSDSMTILDSVGAEKLLGNGDMLFDYNGMGDNRVQGAYVTDEEIEDICDYLRTYKTNFLITPESLAKNKQVTSKSEALDPYFMDVARYVIENNYASINNIQKQFGVGFNRASSIFDQLEAEGIISPKNSKNPRKVMMKLEEFENSYEREE